MSFSGGKDSTVLADIAAQVCKMTNYKLTLWFSDTGLEYPEIKVHVKSFGKYLEDKYGIEVETVIDYPKDRNGNRVTFRQVIEKYGYPIVSKEVSRDVGRTQLDGGIGFRTGKKTYSAKALDGELPNLNGKPNPYNKTQWAYLVDAPFKISDQCCSVMKKRPAHRFDKESGLKPIIATMTCESMQRRSQWLKTGCNSFDMKNPASKPISFWTEQDVLKYIFDYNIPIASVYGEIKQDDNGKYYTTGLNRTGCIFCGFGCHLEKEPNRFQQLEQNYPKIYDYCMKPWDEGGLGMDEVLNYINVKH